MREGEECKGCEFFFTLDPNAVQGVCQRYPPTNIIVPSKGPDGKQFMTSGGSAYPVITATGWCGEWKRGKVVKVAKAMPNLRILPGSQN